jgi:hypothetical protein
MTLPLTLAGGLRTAFADVVSSPLPEHLATVMRRLSADGDARFRGGAQLWGKRNRNAAPY